MKISEVKKHIKEIKKLISYLPTTNYSIGVFRNGKNSSIEYNTKYFSGVVLKDLMDYATEHKLEYNISLCSNIYDSNGVIQTNTDKQLTMAIY